MQTVLAARPSARRFQCGAAVVQATQELVSLLQLLRGVLPRGWSQPFWALCLQGLYRSSAYLAVSWRRDIRELPLPSLYWSGPFYQNLHLNRPTNTETSYKEVPVRRNRHGAAAAREIRQPLDDRGPGAQQRAGHLWRPSEEDSHRISPLTGFGESLFRPFGPCVATGPLLHQVRHRRALEACLRRSWQAKGGRSGSFVQSLPALLALRHPQNADLVGRSGH